MKYLNNINMIYFKGFLFLLGGLLSAILIIIEQPTMKMFFLLVVSVWCFARCYYFIFYVIQYYVDSDYEFSGLWSFVRYMLRNKK
jgi:hypothetical protein